jgi:hypothetical protein
MRTRTCWCEPDCGDSLVPSQPDTSLVKFSTMSFTSVNQTVLVYRLVKAWSESVVYSKTFLCLVQHNRKCKPEDRWVAAASVCAMLKQMRILLLQDAVFLPHLNVFSREKRDAIFGR